MDYNQTLLHFKCIKKGVFIDTTYYLYLFTSQLLIANKLNDQNPKYQYQISLGLNISWHQSQQNNNQSWKDHQEAFTICDQVKSKKFYAQPFFISQLRSALAAQVMYSNLKEFYLFDQNTFTGGGSAFETKKILKIDEDIYYSCKCIEKKSMKKPENLEALKMEIQTMEKISHPNVISIYETFEDENSFYLIQDLIEGGNLSMLLDKNIYGLDEISCKIILHKLLLGIQEIHINGIMHRDLTPENILFKEKNNQNSLKISDFRFANFIDTDKFIYLKCGTPGYVAPEIANLDTAGISSGTKINYSKECDMFSIGCIFYQMITGSQLFKGSCASKILKSNKLCNIDLQTQFDDINKFTQESNNLCLKLLQKDPAKRITAEKALQHAYFEQLQNVNPRERKFLFHNSKSLLERSFSKSSTIQQEKDKKQTSINDSPEENLKQIEHFPVHAVPNLCSDDDSEINGIFITKLNKSFANKKIESKSQGQNKGEDSIFQSISMRYMKKNNHDEHTTYLSQKSSQQYKSERLIKVEMKFLNDND